MKFDWKLQPLQRKLEWDLDLARGRFAALCRQHEQACDALRILEGMHATQAAAALAAMRQGTDPALHGQALAWLAGAESQLARRRRQCAQARAAVEAARSACQRCNERLEAVSALHGEARARFAYGVQRDAAKEADFDWLARRAGQEAA